MSDKQSGEKKKSNLSSRKLLRFRGRSVIPDQFFVVIHVLGRSFASEPVVVGPSQRDLYGDFH